MKGKLYELKEIAVCYDAKTLKSVNCANFFGKGYEGNCPKWGEVELPKVKEKKKKKSIDGSAQYIVMDPSGGPSNTPFSIGNQS